MQSRPARVVRGFVAAVVSTVIAAFSHAAGGGAFPHPLILLAGILFTGTFCIALTGRRVSLLRVVLSVVATQATFHVLFSMTGGSALAAGGSVHAGHHAMPVTSSMGAVASDTGLLPAHVVAAVLTILALRFGESAFWGLLDTARLMLATLLRSRMPALPWAAQGLVSRADDRGVVPVPVSEFLAAVPHRGPPLRPNL